MVNALSERLEVEVARAQTLYRQVFQRGAPLGKLETVGRVANRRGTKVRFKADPQIFKENANFSPARLFKMARAKAYLFGGVEIRWKCAQNLLEAGGKTPAEAVFHFPGGLKDYLAADIDGKELVAEQFFTGRVEKPERHGSLEWAVTWLAQDDGFVHSYCNTIPTPDGGTHESGLRLALLRALKDHAERIGQGKRAAAVTTDDIMNGCAALISVFIREPEFQGQNKSRLMSLEASRIVESTMRDAFDHWLAGSPAQASRLLDWAIERAEDRLRRRAEKTWRARAPRANYACPASSRIARIILRKALKSLSSRAIRRAARRNRRATAPARPSCLYAAKSSMSPARRATNLPPTNSSAT